MTHDHSHDPTARKILAALQEVRDQLEKLARKRERIDEQIQEARTRERSIQKTLEVIGIEPETPPVGPRQPLAARGAPVRGIEAAMKVVQPGETLTMQEVARRVQAAGLPFESKNPANALATAMARSPSFERMGRGRFRRLEPGEDDDEEAPPPRHEAAASGASAHGGLF